MWKIPDNKAGPRKDELKGIELQKQLSLNEVLFKNDIFIFNFLKKVGYCSR